MRNFQLLALGLILAGCTVHPTGEREVRMDAEHAGQRFNFPLESRPALPLPDNPTPDDLVNFALLNSADLEQKYWQWRAAIEQIPIDGTQPTNLALSANVGIERGRANWAQTILSAGNDPMADIILPPKLTLAAQRSLEMARAAGLRFRKAQVELRAKVLSAWYDYALMAELIRLDRSSAQLLKTTVTIVEARNQAGAAGQLDVLKARNEADMSANDAAAMQALLPAQRAAINALLSRQPGDPLVVPEALPGPMAFPDTDEQFLDVVEQRNPELAALKQEIAARRGEVELARLQRLPDISISAGTDLKGIAQSVIGSVTVPWLRHESIEAAINQAQANLRAAQAMRRQSNGDLASQLVSDLNTIRDADRQLHLFDQTIFPRAERSIALARSAYETGHATLLDLLDTQRSAISVRRLVVNLRAARDKRVLDVMALVAR